MIQQLLHLQELLPYFFLIGAAAAYIAHFKKQRNPILWFFIGFFFGLLGLISLFFLNKKSQINGPVKQPPAFEPTILIKSSLSLPWYYVNNNHEQEGPVSAQRLANLIEKKQLNLDSLVWNEEFVEWKQIKEVPEYIQIIENL